MFARERTCTPPLPANLSRVFSHDAILHGAAGDNANPRVATAVGHNSIIDSIGIDHTVTLLELKDMLAARTELLPVDI